MEVSPRLPRCGSRKVCPRLFLHGYDGDLIPERTRGVEHEKGEAAVAGDDTKPHGCVGMLDAPGRLRERGGRTAPLLVGNHLFRPPGGAPEDHTPL
jgi:hypothetical protein